MTSDKIQSWFKSRDVKKLIKTLKEGDYNARALSAKYLGELRALEAIPDLKNSLNDPVKMVVEYAGKSLLAMSLDPEIGRTIEQRLQQFQLIEIRSKENLDQVVAKRGDPLELELKKMKEILILSGAKKLEIAERQKSNDLAKWLSVIVGVLAVLAAILKAFFFWLS